MKGMSKYIIERVLFVFLTMFVILSITYILIQCLPIEPTGASTAAARWSFWEKQVELGFYHRVSSMVGDMDSTGLEKVTINGANYYYEAEPILYRYAIWLRNIVTRFDWGTSTSIMVNQSAVQILALGLPYSMRLNLISIVISVPLGIGLGILAALKKNTWIDTLISTIIMIFISVPSFVLISYLILWLGQVGIPIRWPSDAEAAADPILAIKAYIIPVSALSFGSICSFARYTRAELTEVMSSEFLLLARTKGLTRSQSVVRHALRNSMVPIVPMIIAQFIGILSGSMVLEQIYGIPGIGHIFVDALTARDYPVIMVDMAIYTTIGLFATLLVDLSYGIVDPRIRMGARK